VVVVCVCVGGGAGGLVGPTRGAARRVFLADLYLDPNKAHGGTFVLRVES
jgi:hypothetical protein